MIKNRKIWLRNTIEVKYTGTKRKKFTLFAFRNRGIDIGKLIFLKLNFFFERSNCMFEWGIEHSPAINYDLKYDNINESNIDYAIGTPNNTVYKDGIILSKGFVLPDEGINLGCLGTLLSCEENKNENLAVTLRPLSTNDFTLSTELYFLEI